MTDENQNAAADNANNGSDTPQPPRMQILAQFVRDLSFENIVAQKGLNGSDVKPEIAVQVSLDARKRSVENQYEVIAKFRVSSKNSNDDSNLFLCELDYGGVFHVAGVPEEQLHPFLMIECPRMLFPFIRRIISDTTRDGGFPPVNLDPVDFVALYRQEIARRAQAERPANAPVS
ncbi:protein-export chaperone SecB [Paracoccus aerodenitrificans]|uniref:protein-export chaperone SecB n=1 Tax=Paracoccus aerodenitrificans TaxID=3017781 RepID=UPI0022F07946|nr:protein-export chaperone SecB [Paracoccus aerodenitrificans]WBU63805.1 protein-export chaperone SecB [Paracoccus aerodenitrificans]